jgi:XisI protein/XisH protein
MPARDRDHDIVRRALEKEGWTVTDDLREKTKIILCHIADFYKMPERRTLTIFDENNDEYILLDEGWKGSHRIHKTWIHIEIRDSKIWIHCDGTEQGVALDFLQAGIPKEQIVLAFQHPARRERGEFATI